ncbi:hypothetical protein [Caloranaerobacter sp. DY30410]|uniref:hypothetical protein n=1 Tax=Caloranaerobacter sp. DY30410 TaxID=3238305 RepID=UPI003CFCD090
MKDNSKIDFNKIIPFDWDEIYIFEPYIPREKIFNTVGSKWISSDTTFIEYLFSESTGLYTANLKKIVFLNNKKVIYDTNYNKYTFDFSENYYSKQNHVFNIKRKKIDNMYIFIFYAK